MSTVKQNDTVQVHYTGKLTNGQVFDSSEGREPLEIQLGQGMLIPGFEEGLLDMGVSEKKTITIPVDKAYGEVQDNLFQTINRSELPGEIEPEVGMGLVARNPDGREQQLRIAKVEAETVTLDANHPLAGQDLVFDLELVAIK